MRYLMLPVLLSLPLAAYAGNIKDTDLITSNTFFLPPTTANTVFIQARNSSDNQGVSLTDLGSRLTAKGLSDHPRPQRGALHPVGEHRLLQYHKAGNAGRAYRRRGIWIGHRLLDHGRPARSDWHGQHGGPAGCADRERRLDGPERH